MVIVDLRSYLAQNQPAGRDYASRRHADIDIDVNVETTITYPSGNLGTEPAAQQHGHCHGHLAPARQATPKMKKIPGGMFKKDKWVPIER